VTISMHQMLQDAAALKSALEADEWPQEPAVLRLRQEVRQQADDLERQGRDPIAIGVVGEYSVGKSMLIGTLLGRPDLLPVEQRAATGNVTALYLNPGEPGLPTTLDGDAVVEYMSEPELVRCVEYMLGELAAATRAIHRDDILEPLEGYDPLTAGWDRLDAWCRTHIWPTQNGREPIDNLEVRKIAAELLLVRDGHLCGRELLSSQVTVRQQIVRHALDLGDGSMTTNEFPRRSGAPALTLDDVRTDGARLGRSFPLIRRVKYQVKVDPNVWPLQALRGDYQVVLLDFPGLTARRSAKRDDFLSRTALADIHTIITVYDAAKAGTDRPDTFYTMLQQHGRPRAELRESILAVGNALDKVTSPILPESGPITVDDLCAASQQFREFYDGAMGLVGRQEERITVTSSVVAIEQGRLETTFGAEEQARLEKARAGVRRVVSEWHAISRRLADGEAGSPWAAATGGFAADGGFAHLRAMIEGHARAHGLANKLSNMRRCWKKMCEGLDRLARVMPRPEVSRSRSEVEQVRARISSLADEMRQHHERLTRLLNDFRTPLTVPADDGRPLITGVRDRAIVDVATWGQWRAILHRAEGGLIRKDTPAEQASDNKFTKRVKRLSGGGHDTTAAFEDAFRETCRTHIHSGRQKLSEAVRQWLGERDIEAASLRDRFDDTDLRDALGAGLLRLYGGDVEEAENRVDGLRMIIDLEWAEEPPPKDADLNVDRPAAVDGFPPPRPRALPWHADVPEKDGDTQQRLVRHQLYLFRQRRELANAASAVVTAELVQEIERFYEDMRSSFKEARKYLLTTEDIRRMFPVEAAQDSDDEHDEKDEPANGSEVHRLLREWKERDDQSGV